MLSVVADKDYNSFLTGQTDNELELLRELAEHFNLVFSVMIGKMQWSQQISVFLC